MKNEKIMYICLGVIAVLLFTNIFTLLYYRNGNTTDTRIIGIARIGIESIQESINNSRERIAEIAERNKQARAAIEDARDYNRRIREILERIKTNQTPSNII